MAHRIRQNADALALKEHVKATKPIGDDVRLPGSTSWSAAKWAAHMADLRSKAPSSMEKMFGKNGPPNEAAKNAHMQRLKEHARNYTWAAANQKKALERDNKAFKK